VDTLLPQRCSLIAETVESLRSGIEAGHWLDTLPGESAERTTASRTHDDSHGA